ncbi:MAG: class II aldolase/adducin family protein [Thiotrichales bacterium]
MNPIDGVTKFALRFTATPPLANSLLRELRDWRQRFYQIGIIGQDPARYGGVGFGNVSRRLAGEHLAFVISGTQTGGLATLDTRHFARVTRCDVERNLIEAEGPIAPSSEALTHGALYQCDPAIGFVFHGHAPRLWQAATELRLPLTAPAIAYGTPEMAREMARLWHASDLPQRRILIMGGHEDGVVSFGGNADEAGAAMLAALALTADR